MSKTNNIDLSEFDSTIDSIVTIETELVNKLYSVLDSYNYMSYRFNFGDLLLEIYDDEISSAEHNLSKARDHKKFVIMLLKYFKIDFKASK